MDRIKQIALAQKNRLLESVLSTPQSLLTSITDGDRNITKVVIDGDPPNAVSSGDGTDRGTAESSAAAASASPFSYSTDMVCAILRAVEESKVITHLSIINRTDASEFISALTPILSKNLTLKYLRLDGVDIGDDLAMPLFGSLAKNSSIETAIFSDINLTRMDGVTLFLRHTQVLRILDLSGNNFDSQGFVSLAEGLRFVSSSELKEIRLSNTNMKDFDANLLCSVLEENTDYCPSLRLLDCGLALVGSGSGSTEPISDATRLRVMSVIDQRISKAAASAAAKVGGGNAKGAEGSDRNSIGGSVPTSSSAMGSGSAAVTSPKKASDARSDRGSAGDAADATTDEPQGGRGTDEASLLADGVGATDAASGGLSVSPRPAPTILPSPPLTFAAAAAAPPAVPPTAGFTQADINAAVAAALSNAASQHEAKITKLAELLGDSQSQAQRLQEELQLRTEKLASVQADAKAVKEASKAMHQQFQLQVTQTEAAAAKTLKDAGNAMEALRAKLKEVTDAAVAQKNTFEQTVAAEKAQQAALEAENQTLRGDYIAELKAAIAMQQRAVEAAQFAPSRTTSDAEVQTDASLGEDFSGGLSRGGAGHRGASIPPQLAMSASGAALAPPRKPSAAAAYDDAVGSFALIDADEARDTVVAGDTSRWKKDEDATHCTTCLKEFTLTRRRHHCRRCGGIFCSDCMTKSTVDGKMVCNRCARSDTVLLEAGKGRK